MRGRAGTSTPSCCPHPKPLAGGGGGACSPSDPLMSDLKLPSAPNEVYTRHVWCHFCVTFFQLLVSFTVFTF